jgi:hypothetical protein
MANITYRAVAKGYSVSVGGRVVGHIRMTLGGNYRYYPLGVKTGGESFATLEQCKRSLVAPS